MNSHWCSQGCSQQNNRCEKVGYTSVNFSKNIFLPHKLTPKVKIMNSHWFSQGLKVARVHYRIASKFSTQLQKSV